MAALPRPIAGHQSGKDTAVDGLVLKSTAISAGTFAFRANSGNVRLNGDAHDRSLRGHIGRAKAARRQLAKSSAPD
jgi:hypothetical protein